MNAHHWLVEQFVKTLAESGNWTVETLRDDEKIKTSARVFYIAMPRILQALIELKGGQAWFEGFALQVRDGLLTLSPTELAALGIGRAGDAAGAATAKLIDLTKGAADLLPPLPTLPAMPAMPAMPNIRALWPIRPSEASSAVAVTQGIAAEGVTKREHKAVHDDAEPVAGVVQVIDANRPLSLKST